MAYTGSPTGGIESGTHPFQIELLDLGGAATWSTFQSGQGDEWWLTAGVVRIVNRDVAGVVKSMRLYPEHAWYALRFTP